MSTAIPIISTTQLLVAFIPALVVIAIMIRWRTQAREAMYASARMLIQLLLIGYVLIGLFESDHPALIGATLFVMLAAASWIALVSVPNRKRGMLGDAFLAISVGSLPTLALVTHFVIQVEPWFAPRFVIPLGGMIFASAMNTVSLAAERFDAEVRNYHDPLAARRIAFQASMIPMINSFFAVGLVTLPGMMTGQVLSGVSPLIAAKYQIVVMTMLFGASGMAAAIYLYRRAILNDATTAGSASSG